MPKWVESQTPIAPVSLGENKMLKPERLGNVLSRTLGLEIELSVLHNVRGPLANGMELEGQEIHWVHDGSITPGGQELVIGPWGGDAFIRGISQVANHLSAEECEADKSCGLHVHVGAQDFGALELRRLWWLYCKVEKELFGTVVSKTREGGRYCQSYRVGEAFWEELWAKKIPQEIKHQMVMYLYQDKVRQRPGCIPTYLPTIPDTKAHKYQACRYYGLNLHSWMQRGTVEWRQCQGTVDFQRLLYWPLFCGWFVELASAMRDEEARGVHGLVDVVNFEVKRPFIRIKMPDVVKEWVRVVTEKKGES